MQLLLLTPPETQGNELPLVTHFLQCGLDKLHIRKPSYSSDDYRDYINAIPTAFHNRLVIHGAFGLAPSFPGMGIHLRSSQRRDAGLVQELKQLMPASCSSSFHSWREIMENDDDYTYAFISPVFDSISKKGYKAAIDLAGHRELKQWGAQQKKRLPHIVGLGGVNATTIPLLQDNGFEGAAILGAIWESADPMSAFNDLKQALR
jgi:thiamine-phosphate pyrophosphorylase